MHGNDLTVETSALGVREIDRRTIAKGVAWTVPVVIVATAAPAAAASGSATPVLLSVTGSNNGNNYAATLSFNPVSGAPTVKLTFLTVNGANRLSTAAPNQKDVTSSDKSFPFAFTSTLASQGQTLVLRFTVNGSPYQATLSLDKNGKVSSSQFN